MVGARSGDGGVKTFKDVVLRTVVEVVEVGVKGWGVGTLVHLIPTVRDMIGVRETNEDSHCSFLPGTSRRGSWHHKCSYRA